MDADNRDFGQAEEVVIADRALCPIEYPSREAATRSLQADNVLTATSPATANDPSYGHEKFGVEEHALYDFRDYGLD